MGKRMSWLFGFSLLFCLFAGIVQAYELADTDGDGVNDSMDACPADSLKIGPGLNGCGVSDADSLQVGGWWPGSNNEQTGGIISLTFYPNGTYIHGQNGDNTDSSWIGIEYGSYAIDPVSNELTVSVIFDQNGEVGFSHPKGLMSLIAVDADTFILDTINEGTINLYRVVEAIKPEVGNWWVGANNPAAGGIANLTFYPNGTFIHCQNGTNTEPFWVGIEYGTYSIDPATKALTTTIIYDQNGGVGLSNPNGQTYFEVSGNTAVISELSGPETLMLATPAVNVNPLTITKNGTGVGSVVSTVPDTAINCGYNCYASYIDSTSISLTATANPGNTFSGWTGCDNVIGNTCTVATNGNRMITATFADTTPPALPVVSGATPTNDATPTWSWVSGGGGNGTFKYKLEGAGVWSAATTATSYTPATPLSEGNHVLYVKEGDAAGNWSTAASKTIVIDLTPLDTAVTSNPMNPTRVAEASFSFTKTGTGTLQCRLDANPYEACTSPKSYASLAEGVHTFSVKAIDPVGNEDPTPATFTWTIDMTRPTTPVVNGVTPTNDTTPTWSWSSAGGGTGTFRYNLDTIGMTGVPEVTATSFTPATALLEGAHTLYVQERDEAGNWSLVGSKVITIVKPSISGVTPTNDTTPTWSWTSGGAGNGSFKYKLELAGVWSALTTATSFTPASPLPAGNHTLYVKEVDATGNWSAAVSKTIVIDLTPLDTALTSKPVSLTKVTRAAFKFTKTGTGAFQCRLDEGAYEVCKSPKYYTGLMEGEHTFNVKAIDPAGNEDPTPATFTWTIDLTKPAAPVVSGATPTSDTTPTWSWVSGGDGGNGTFRYRLDSSSMIAATVTKAADFTPATPLALGTHTLYLQERDAAGNWSLSGSMALVINPPVVRPASFIISAISGNTSESGTTAIFTIHLDSQPTADVTIPISSSNTNEGTVAISSLTFTNTTWNNDQTITVTGVDDDIEDGNQTFAIVLSAASSSDTNYNNLNPDDVIVTNVDIVDAYSVTPAISAGNYHNLVLANDGSVWGWGSCDAGQLGICAESSLINGVVLPQKLDISKAAAISAGYFFSAIIKSDKTVWTSGSNEYGRLGHAASTSFAQVEGLTDVKTVAAGTYHVLALKNDGTVWAWGKGSAGQLGNSAKISSQSPVQSLGALVGKTISGIALGQDHSLASDNTGIAYSWGSNGSEQLGFGGSGGDSLSTPSPTAITTLSSVSMIAAGLKQSFAVGIKGGVSDTWAWGDNTDAQLGATLPSAPKTSPTAVNFFNSNIIPSKLDSGYYHSAALIGTNVYTWGDNDGVDPSSHESSSNNGALGLGTPGNEVFDDKVPPTLAFTAGGATMDVNTGNNYTLVLKSDGRLMTSGQNNSAQLGTNEIDSGMGDKYTSIPRYVEDPGDAGKGSNSSFYAYRPILAGYPATSTKSNSATIAVCAGSLAAPANCGPITHYKYRTSADGSNWSNWSTPASIASPINLSELPIGPVLLGVKGIVDDGTTVTEIQTDISAVIVAWTVNP